MNITRAKIKIKHLSIRLRLIIETIRVKLIARPRIYGICVAVKLFFRG